MKPERAPPSNRPASEAVVAVVVDGKRFLLIQRGPSGPGPGYWAPVTGTIEAGETQAAAVAREVREEVGLEVRPIRKVWECVSFDGTHRLHWWLAVPAPGRPAPSPREVSEVRWCDRDEYARLDPTFPTDREFFAVVFPSVCPTGTVPDSPAPAEARRWIS